MADHLDRQPGGWSSTTAMQFLTLAQGRAVAMVAIVLLATGYAWLGERYWHPVRSSVFDAYQRAFPRQLERLPVVIVDIDDASLAALGQWPWPRSRLARLIEATYALGALAVGLNLLMPEADRLSPALLLAERPDVSPALRDALATLPSNDLILAQTLSQVPSVVGRAGVYEDTRHAVPLGGQTPVRVYGDTPVSHVPGYAGHITNVPAIEQAAFGHAYLNASPDADGVIRAVPLLIAVHGKLAPTFALELLRVAVGEKYYSVHADRRGVRSIQIGQTFMPTDADGRIRLYYTPPDPRRRLSAVAVLNGADQTAVLSQKVAIIGVTAVGLTDIATTPVAAHMDGVEIQAQVIENLLAGTRLLRPLMAQWLELCAFLVVAVVYTVLLPRLRPAPTIAIFLVTVAVLATASLIAFLQKRWLFDPTFASAGTAVLLVVFLTVGFAQANRSRRELRAAIEMESHERSRMAGELQAARDIQMGMLPDPRAIDGLPSNLEFQALLEPAAEVGGDFYDAFMLDEYRFCFLVGDVAGKGVPASLFMALSKTMCKTIALREHSGLEELLILANKEVSRENPANLFVTLVTGLIDVRTGVMELCSAGHEAPILLRLGAAPCCLDTVGGPPLCVLEDFHYTASRIQLQSYDTLVLITDGVTEAQDADQNLYGLHRALGYFAAMHTDENALQTSVETVCQGLYRDVKRFTSGTPAVDDITIMAIRFTSSSTPIPVA